jgi:DivIVA domain-containing protein
MLTPQAIEKKKFATTRFKEGYDQSEVDAFMDQVVADYTELYRQMNMQAQRASVATQVLPAATSQPVSIESATRLLAATEVACAQYEQEAKAEAVRITDEAVAQAKKIVDEGTTERHRQIGELEDHRSKVQTKVDDLVKVEAEVTTRLRDALERWNG